MNRYIQYPEGTVSVTEMIARYFPPSRFYTKLGRDQGSALHDSIHFMLQGDLDRSSVDTVIAPRLAQFERFMADSGFKPTHIERSLYSAEYELCGRPDAIGILNGQPCVIDWKRGASLKTHRLQTAGYKILAKANGIKIINRYALYLGNTNYSLCQHKDLKDEFYFGVLLAGPEPFLAAQIKEIYR